MLKQARSVLMCAGLNGGTCVVIGAFAAHALQHHLDERSMSVLKTGLLYQQWHTLVLLFIAVAMRQWPGLAWHWPARLVATGIGFFSLSLYMLALGMPSWLGLLTPLGGLFFIGAWLVLFLMAYKARDL
ncbi:DUF423 domain-containing protein [Agaribacterium sp. ZY112]|uniref:DUF423 domain-containing protein n=1 Tax=Agaribacterium sp. ZY112 TaxID=3233574 RepID=UPI0035234AEF